MKINVPYGTGEIAFSLSEENFLARAEAKEFPVTYEPEAIVRAALRNPIGQKQLHELAKGKKTVAIIISDYTRPTPTAYLLPFILDELAQGGIAQEDITVITATGLHDPDPEADVKRMLGDCYGKLKLIRHDATDDKNLVYLGETTRGTPIFINSCVAKADLKLSIGGIEPHHSAGWSGGSKNVLPGVSGKKTVLVHHARAHEPGVELGRIKGNPFREDLDEVGVKVGIDFIFNVILNKEKRIVAAFAGDLIKAHRAGVERAQSMLAVKILQAPDIIVATPGGSPRDGNFWQAKGKALTRVRPVIKRGGIIILAARGEGGIGKEEFANILSNNSRDEILEKFHSQDFSVVLNKAFRLTQVIDKATLFVVSEGFKKEMFAKLPVEIFTSLDEAVRVALERQGGAAKVLVVPKAPSVIIEVEGQ